MRNSSGLLVFLGLAVVVIIGGLLAGYYYKGSGSSTPPAQTAAQAPPLPAPVVSTPAPAPKHQVTTATDYTAPGAPDIEIAEVKGAAIPRKPSSDTTIGIDAAPSPSDNPQPAATDNGATTPPADNSAMSPGTDTTNPGDNTDTSSPDNGANSSDQLGDNPLGTPGSDTGPLYRVQAGSFINESNARILASALRHRGYSAVAVPGTEDGKPVFKVQVGAYRNKALAEQAATDLQKTGYPAYVSK